MIDEKFSQNKYTHKHTHQHLVETKYNYPLQVVARDDNLDSIAKIYKI